MKDEENATYVQQSGLAVVHQGNRIVAAADAQAALAAEPGTEAHYHFPIDVVVSGDAGDGAGDAIRAQIWAELNAALM